MDSNPWWVPSAGMLIVAHVIELLVRGNRDGIVAVLGGQQKEYECTGQILGPDPGDVLCLNFVGRTRTLTSEGIEWEGDSKHVG